jgi:hypothetical protein
MNQSPFFLPPYIGNNMFSPNPAKPDAGMLGHKSHLSPSANIHAKACMFLVKGLNPAGLSQDQYIKASRRTKAKVMPFLVSYTIKPICYSPQYRRFRKKYDIDTVRSFSTTEKQEKEAFVR